MDRKTIERYLRETHVVRPPKHLLSTFGATRIEYHLVSPLEGTPSKTRLREGLVVSERPKVLTPEALRERFEGFGDEAAAFRDYLDARYADLLRALEYRFRNDGLRSTVVASLPEETSARIVADVDSRDVAQAAVITTPDAAWSLALMSFTLEEAKRSFPTNVQDLDRRGKFQ
ncbi:hypothetical protein EPO15_02125 [bacterium]|nr:MAG: hypothetical protein EPO15_02125 [bacterium]